VALASRGLHIALVACVLIIAAAAGLGRGAAQQPTPGPSAEFADRCPGLVAGAPPRHPADGVAAASGMAAPFIPAAWRQDALRTAAISSDQVRITYVGHSSFLIESPRLVRIVTDFNDYVRPPLTPDIVTMNHAHSTHYTDRPDPAIKHVLRGWGPSPAEPARHDMTLQDVRVRNVPTNIRDWSGGTERHGNSIFVFETAQLCIAHLGHLHHTLTQQQLNEIGRLDVVLVPVDGGATLDLDGMFEVLTSLKASLMIPMHYFSAYTLNRFLSRAKEQWDVEFNDTPSILTSKATLPAKPKVLVLQGR
jgi:L-ascorbate metabolism protein UlaG (beta-lactamase superfamily)